MKNIMIFVISINTGSEYLKKSYKIGFFIFDSSCECGLELIVVNYYYLSMIKVIFESDFYVIIETPVPTRLCTFLIKFLLRLRRQSFVSIKKKIITFKIVN